MVLIITFIENEFPKTEKYLKIISLLKEFIKNDKDLVLNISETGNNVGKILLDLARWFKLDSLNDLHIDLHPKVKKTSLKLFSNNHYAEAIFEAVKALNNYVKDKAGIIDKDLSDAMAKAFKEDDPIIKLNNLATRSDIDEQKGFKLLFMGAMTGIRNPKAHENIIQVDKNRTLEYLAFISLLFRRAEEGKL